MESLGYILPEGVMLLFVLMVGLAVLGLRRRLKGERAFTDRDHRFFFGRSRAKTSFLAFGRAVVLFSVLALIEVLILEPFGAAILSGVLLITLLAVVRFTLM